MLFEEFFEDKYNETDMLTKVYNRNVIFSYIELLISKNTFGGNFNGFMEQS